MVPSKRGTSTESHEALGRFCGKLGPEGASCFGAISSRNPKARSAGALVPGESGADSVGAVAADEASVLICDHRPALDADKAIGAADD